MVAIRTNRSKRDIMLSVLLISYISHGVCNMSGRDMSRNEARQESKRLLAYYEEFKDCLSDRQQEQIYYDISYLKMVISDSRIYSADTNEEWL